MKNIVNNRPLALFALCLVLAVVSFYLSIFWGLIIVVCAYIIILGLFTIWLSRDYSLFNLIFSIICLTFVVIISIRCYHIAKNYLLFSSYSANRATVLATVKNVTYSNVYNRYIVTFTNVKINGISYDFNIIGGVEQEFIKGQTISFCANLSSIESDQVRRYLTENIVLEFSGFDGFMLVSENITLFTRISLKIKQVLMNVIPDNFDFAVALMLGDTDFLDTYQLVNFRYSGIAHIFAVSGLHVGFMCSVIGFLCEGFYIKHFRKCIVVTLFALIYSGLCGFSVSSQRAVVVCFWLLLCKSFGKKYDNLNAIAIAIITVVIISPFSAISFGFILSFGSILSIILFKQTFMDILDRTHLPLKDAISIALSVVFGMTPFTCYLFGYSSLTASVLNVVFIPMTSALFTMLIFSVVFAFVRIPVSLKIVGIIIGGIKNLFEYTSFSKFAVFLHFTPQLLFLYYFFAIFASDIINISKNKKLAIIITLFVSMFILAL